MGLKDIRFFALIAAIILYGLRGSPTPDHPGLAEMIVGLLLILAADPVRAFKGLTLQGRFGFFWQYAAQGLLVYGLTVPLLAGLARGNGAGLILRDLFPFLFLLLPFFIVHRDKLEERRYRLLTAMCVFAGLAFAVRGVAGIYAGDGGGWLGRPASRELLYLTNAPTVLFAALMLAGMALHKLAYPKGLKGLALAMALLAVSLMPFLAMAAVMQRASLGYAALALIALLGLRFYRTPYRALPLFLVLGAFLITAAAPLRELWLALEAKTLLVGVNMRMEEAAAVMDILGENALSVMFGRGWGATFASPAVGGLSVNFTHSLLTALWLKTGLCGLSLAVLYLSGLAAQLGRIIMNNPVLGLALAGPFLIDIFLYASYKSLDFGLILLLIAVAQPVRERCKKALPHVYNVIPIPR